LTEVLGVFAASALLLAAFGVYGVVGYRVASRMKEIAIRIALGAPRWRVTSVVLNDTISCLAAGLVVGIPLSLAAAATIRSYLFGVEPADGVTLMVACVVVIAAALLAAYLPARRAPRVDPIAALRIE
jgi:putative ABC transport system permease protein